MSQIQSEAMSTVMQLITGSKATLYRKQQVTLAAWVAMANIIAEHDPLTYVTIPAADRAFVFKKRQPPTHWRIWIGDYQGDRTHAAYVHVPIILTDQAILSDPDYD